jgi:hypothetical protein
MTDVLVSWVLPTTREPYKPGATPSPLPESEIDAMVLEISADGGANYVVTDEFPPDVQETTVPELDPGTWFFRGTVRDTKGRMSKPITRSKVIEDTSPPGALVELTLT